MIYCDHIESSDEVEVRKSGLISEAKLGRNTSAAK